MNPAIIHIDVAVNQEDQDHRRTLLEVHEIANPDRPGVSPIARLAQCRSALVRLVPALVEYVSAIEAWAPFFRDGSGLQSWTGELLSRIRELRTVLQVVSGLLEEESSDNARIERLCTYLRICVEDWITCEARATT